MVSDNHRARQVCETELAGRYELEVIDICQQPTLGADQQIVAVPTLIKELPAPVRRLVGDLTDRERGLLARVLRPKSIPR
jgi:circadian clock protein KaiB